MVNGQNPRGPEGFWPQDLLRHSIQHDTPKAFPYDVILLFFQYLSFAGQTLEELNPNILVQDVERVYDERTDGSSALMTLSAACNKKTEQQNMVEVFFQQPCTLFVCLYIYRQIFNPAPTLDVPIFHG